jgi:hypothetical protein
MPRTDTETIARIMATGYNRHIDVHGPDGSYASEAIESGDGHSVVVERAGSQFAVRVDLLPALTNDAPMTPGQCWAALKGWLEKTIEADLAVADEFRDGTPEHQASAAAHYAMVSGHRTTLAKMRELEG